MSQENQDYPKIRQITELLEKEAFKIYEETGKSKGEVLADLIWQGVLQSVIHLPSSITLRLSQREWLDLMKVVYGQIDGPVPQQKVMPGEVKVYIIYGDDDSDGNKPASADKENPVEAVENAPKTS